MEPESMFMVLDNDQPDEAPDGHVAGVVPFDGMERVAADLSSPVGVQVPDPLMFTAYFRLLDEDAGDFPSNGQGWNLMSQRMFDVIRSVAPIEIVSRRAWLIDDLILDSREAFDANGEPIPGKVRTDYVVVETVPKVDMIDWEQSSYRQDDVFDDSYDFTNTVLKPMDNLPPLFRIPGVSSVYTFMSPACIEACETAGLKGLHFMPPMLFPTVPKHFEPEACRLAGRAGPRPSEGRHTYKRGSEMPLCHVMLRRRSVPHHPVVELHDSIVAGLNALGSPWWQPGARPPAPKCVPDFRPLIDIDRFLDGIDATFGNAYITYANNTFLEDDHDRPGFDDYMELRLEATSMSAATYRELVRVGFPGYVRAFAPYRAHVSPDYYFAMDDEDDMGAFSAETGVRVNGRDTVWRIEPVAYFDRELCRRSFSLTPEEIAARLSGKLEHVELIGDGVLLIATSEVVDADEMLAIDARIRDWLGIRHPRHELR